MCKITVWFKYSSEKVFTVPRRFRKCLRQTQSLRCNCVLLLWPHNCVVTKTTVKNEAVQYIRIKFLRVMQGGNLTGVHVRAGQCACWHCDETLSDSVYVAFCLSLLPIAEKEAMTSSLRVKTHPQWIRHIHRPCVQKVLLRGQPRRCTLVCE